MGIGFPKPQRIELPKYLKFVRQHPCLIKDCWKRTEAHHVVFDGQGRTGSKVSDFQTVPLCEEHHKLFHQCGRASFEFQFGLNLYQIIIDLLSEYLMNKEIA